MTTIDYDQASRQLLEELHKSSRELGADWAIMNTGCFREIPGKNYTAKTESTLVYKKNPNEPTTRKITAVLFRSGDHTGDANMQPRKKEGEAELFISVGSSLDGRWIPRLTCFNAVTSDNKGRLTCYKHLTSNREEYLKTFAYALDVTCLRRFDLTFDRSQNYGDPHLIAFDRTLRLFTPIYDADYQIGAFVSFPEPCRELDILRERVRDDGLAKLLDKGKIKL